MDLDRDPKAMARRLRTALAGYGHELGHSQCLKLVARAYGLSDWNTLAAVTSSPPGPPVDRTAIPVLRGPAGGRVRHVHRTHPDVVAEKGLRAGPTAWEGG